MANILAAARPSAPLFPMEQTKRAHAVPPVPISSAVYSAVFIAARSISTSDGIPFSIE